MRVATRRSPAFHAAWIALIAGGCAGGDELRPPGALTVVEAVHHVDIQDREPMLAEVPGSGLFVTGFPRLPHVPLRSPSLWRSQDAGKSWHRVDVGTPDDGAVGNSDTDLAVAPDGTFYFVTMGFNRTTAEGTHIAVGVSRTGGTSWTWTRLADTRLVDRPWVEVAADGTAHVIWNDGAGVSYAVSTNRGDTWEARPRVHPAGGSSHLAVGPGGLVAVRITPSSASGNQFDEGVDLIAVSADAGDTWRTRPAPGTRTWEPGAGAGPVPRWVEPIAWAPDGSLFSLWSEGREMKLGRSRDRGDTWDIWTIARADDVLFFPYLVARDAEQLAASWFSRADGTSVRVAVINLPPGNDANPRVVISEPLGLESWQGTGDDRTRDTAGEYVPVAFLADGDLGLVTPLQDEATNRFGFTWWRLRMQ